MNVYDMNLNDNSSDVVVADNVFEHFMEPEKVLEQANIVLKNGGRLEVPTFNSIYSKYGIHLKHGIRMPWANIFFSEKTICRVMVKLAKERPELLEDYPGLKNEPEKIKDLRRYADLNSMTHKRFKEIAVKSCFEIRSFQVTHPEGA